MISPEPSARSVASTTRWNSSSSVLSSVLNLLTDQLNHLAVIALFPRFFERSDGLHCLRNDLRFDRLHGRVLQDGVARFELERP